MTKTVTVTLTKDKTCAKHPNGIPFTIRPLTALERAVYSKTQDGCGDVIGALSSSLGKTRKGVERAWNSAHKKVSAFNATAWRARNFGDAEALTVLRHYVSDFPGFDTRPFAE